MILERDQVMLDWLNKFKMATPQQLNDVAYNNMKVCYRRLNKLHTDNFLKKYKNTVNMGHIYSTQRIRTQSQLMHNLIRNDFYLKLCRYADVVDVYVENTYGSVRPDITLTCKYNGNFYFFFVEVETNANKHCPNTDKYTNWFLGEWSNYFKAKPTIVYVTDKRITKEDLSFTPKVIPTSLDNFTKIFS